MKSLESTVFMPLAMEPLVMEMA